jgi:hypothetical protein
MRHTDSAERARTRVAGGIFDPAGLLSALTFTPSWRKVARSVATPESWRGASCVPHYDPPLR